MIVLMVKQEVILLVLIHHRHIGRKWIVRILQGSWIHDSFSLLTLYPRSLVSKSHNVSNY